ncbi:hypothetical protein [Paraburkholderia sp. DHOC27]|uniref:hypothetical protein n=1 Tax=Paraburkholderia sp. DHOC27 TaxID=2303330 RepID=UPI000E3C79CE|nr:hypothetical protein [Paraburkholderia sp. DHOC27]RFU48650.1 hypothetical protein D0B32_02085 [Paraburkholderia sp. DHOC27]
MDTVKTDTNAPRLTNGDVLEVLGKIKKRTADMEDAFSLFAAHDKETLKRALKSHISGIREVIEAARTEIFRID